MGKYSSQLEQMRTALTDALHKTGEYSKIEQSFSFQGHSVLGQRAKQQIYCKDNDGIAYLVICHTDSSMPKKLFEEKIKAASDLGVYTIHVLYRYINSKSDESTQGPLFRRFVLEEQKKPNAKYHFKPNYKRNSFAHYPKQRRDNFRRTTQLEREWVPKESARTILYYQKESARLEECIKRYEWKDISRQAKEPILLEDFSTFVLNPMIRKNYGRFLIADMIGLPELTVNTNDERAVKKNLARMAHGVKFGLKTNNLQERICIQLDNIHNQEYEDFFIKLKEYEVPVSDGLRRIVVPSRSQLGVEHFIVEKTKDQKKSYNCSCLGFHFRKKCGHIEELVQKE
jgi:hypothetical protein